MDVFTSSRYYGNPLAVVFDENSSLSHEKKQVIAKEFNLSETIFIGPVDGASNSSSQRVVNIFTPFSELPFAGHPVIGGACAVAIEKQSPPHCAFKTKAGLIDYLVEKPQDASETTHASAEATVPHDVHLHRLGFPASEVDKLQPNVDRALKPTFPVFSITRGMTYVLIEVPSLDALSKVGKLPSKARVDLDEDWQPSFVGYYFYYKAPSSSDTRPIELHTRMVEPEMGEDPVTGSAASALAGYLATKSSKMSTLRDYEFRITQGEHMGRRGSPTVTVKTDSDHRIVQMRLRGNAVRTMRGVLAKPE